MRIIKFNTTVLFILDLKIIIIDLVNKILIVKQLSICNIINNRSFIE